MRLVIGLGNPGSSYEKTRHNVGFLVVEELQKQKTPKDMVIRKSDRFMNSSGEFVREMVGKYNLKPEDLYIVHDDLDIPLGSYKIQLARGPKDHNGIKSIDDTLGTDNYWHVRVGIDNRPLDNRVMGEEYVLEEFKGEERKVLDLKIKEICKKLLAS